MEITVEPWQGAHYVEKGHTVHNIIWLYTYDVYLWCHTILSCFSYG
jgi:hypothetical protein